MAREKMYVATFKGSMNAKVASKIAMYVRHETGATHALQGRKFAKLVAGKTKSSA